MLTWKEKKRKSSLITFSRTTFLWPPVFPSSVWILFSLHCHIRTCISHSNPANLALFLTKLIFCRYIAKHLEYISQQSNELFEFCSHLFSSELYVSFYWHCLNVPRIWKIYEFKKTFLYTFIQNTNPFKYYIDGQSTFCLISLRVNLLPG